MADINLDSEVQTVRLVAGDDFVFTVRIKENGTPAPLDDWDIISEIRDKKTGDLIHTLTFSVATAPDATTCYTILSVAPRATVTALMWIHTVSSDTDKQGNFLASPRGLFNTFDWYDITKDKWDINSVFSPQSELLTTSSSFVYDGAGYIYFSLSSSGDFLQVHKLDVNTRMISGAIQSPFLDTGLHVGKYLNIVESPDGGKFLFLALRTSRLLYKALIG